MSKRKICVVTGSRAEYGLLYWLIKEIESDKNLKLQLIVTGMHLSREFGSTYREIEKDFKIDKKINISLNSDEEKTYLADLVPYCVLSSAPISIDFA